MQSKPRVLVIGDIMLDQYLWGSCERVSAEAPVQIVDIDHSTKSLGGAGNVVNNLISLEAYTGVIACIGDDANGKAIREILAEKRVADYLVVDDSRKTTCKTRVMASHAQVIRYDIESIAMITPSIEEQVLAQYFNVLGDYDIVVLSDYGKGVLTNSAIQKIITQARAVNKKVLVDPKGKDFQRYCGAYLLTPNKKEAEVATGIMIHDKNSLYKALEKLRDIAKLSVSIITLSEEGIAYCENGQMTVKPTAAKEVYDVTGAGDTVLASMGYCLAQGQQLEDAVEFANCAAGIVVGKLGSATVSHEEIERYRHLHQALKHEFGVIDVAVLKTLVLKYQREGKKVVFTNGCFDLLHSGHIRYLKEAKALGDILIVGLNSDASVRLLKGKNRPIVKEADRAILLSALEMVDHVSIFEEETPYELIRELSPDILVKGGDYKDQSIVGRDLVKETYALSMIEGYSTTHLVKRCQGKVDE